jgi:hypothetical protein
VTIKPGAPWGEVAVCPSPITTVADDAALGRWLAGDGGGPVRVSGGDIVRTVGGVSVGRECRRYPIDTLRVVLDGDEGGARTAVAHVVVRRPGRLGWWRGPLWAAMNVSRLGSWDVAPRAHPNDGRVDVVSVDADMPWRSRFQAARRLPSGSHLPHPAITTGRPTNARWEGTSPMTVYVDGESIGQARHVVVTVQPDAAVIHV